MSSMNLGKHPLGFLVRFPLGGEKHLNHDNDNKRSINALFRNYEVNIDIKSSYHAI